jgi:putative tricarboxylic transport membrane protein
MLSLGLPTNATAAVMLAAFTQYGIQPGPLLLQRESQLVWALIASLFVGNTLLLLLNLPLAPAWAKLLRIPRPYLYAGILFFASLGAYSVNTQPLDLILLLILGLLGFAMRRYGLPVLPAIIGVILGPRAELQMRRTFQLSNGEVSGLWSDPLALGIYIVIALVLVWPFINRFVVRPLRRGGSGRGALAAATAVRSAAPGDAATGPSSRTEPHPELGRSDPSASHRQHR